MEGFVIVNKSESRASTELPVAEDSPANFEDEKLESIESKAAVPEQLEINMPKANGHKSQSLEEDEDTNNDDPLSPPPDSPSPVSSQGDLVINDNEDEKDVENDDENDGGNEDENEAEAIEGPQDEIVVGVNNNAPKESPLALASDQDQDQETEEDLEMGDDAVTHYPKRKRGSVYEDISEEKIEARDDLEGVDESPVAATRRPVVKAGGRMKGAHGLGGVKGVTLGYWRDSQAPNVDDKHAVIGFIDIRDRLRTRIENTNRANQIVVNEWPLPPGPGGSWVTFERIVFEKHLVNLDHYQVKEYVKIRAATQRRGETAEEAKAAEKHAVKEAIKKVQQNPPPDTAAPPPIAYGPEIPEHAQNNRPDTKKRRLNSGVGVAGGTPVPSSSYQPNVDSLPGTRPTKILLGYWKGSSEQLINKHAVFGILGANDMFRVKVTRETRDGRPVLGNFPMGAGALWIQYDEVEFEPHLKDLTRPEIKEYVRVRQKQLDDGETVDMRQDNEARAVEEARMRVVPGYKTEPRDSIFTNITNGIGPNGNGPYGNGLNGNGDGAYVEGPDPKPEFAHETRNNSRAAGRSAHQSFPDSSAEFRAANRPSSVESSIERLNTITRREVTKQETNQQKLDQRNAQREAAAMTNNKAIFQDNVSRLNKVWISQEAHRLKAGGEDAKIHAGVKYERKQTGPFQGALVSKGTIISIEGEDYVEYRVLTKPTF